ncbi:Trafficking protein particle complex II-specific subunit 120 [Galdieria sulphuraria]|nr:Trafficking protein particle complex II-specific subunit 120 [Galdieria sulphuraria]
MEVASSIRDLANTRVLVVPIGNVSKALIEQSIRELKNYAVVRLSFSQRWRSHSEALPPTRNNSQEKASGEETAVYRLEFQLCSQENDGIIQLPSSEWETFQLSRRSWGVIGIAQVSEWNSNNQAQSAKIQQELAEVCKQLRKQQPVVMRCLVIQDERTTNRTERDLKYSERVWNQVEEEFTSLDIASVEAESVKDDLESSTSYPKEMSRNDTSIYSATGNGGDSSSEEDNSSNKASFKTSHNRSSSVSEHTLANVSTSSVSTMTSGGGGESSSTIPLKYLNRRELVDSNLKNWLSPWLISFATDIHQAMDFWLRRMMTSADLIVSPMDADKAAEKFSKLVRRRASRLDKYFGDFHLMNGNYHKSFMKYSACAAAARANSDWLWLAGAIEGTCACAILLGRDFTTLSGIANVVEVQPENRDLISQVIQRYDEVCKLYRKKRAFFMEMFACLRLANFLSETGRHSEHLLWLQNSSEVLEKMPNRYPNGVVEDKRIRLLGLLGYAYLQAGCWRKASFYFWREAVGLRRQGDSLAAIAIIQHVIRLFGMKGSPMLDDQEIAGWNSYSLATKESTLSSDDDDHQTIQKDGICKDLMIWPCLIRLALLETASSSRASGHSSVCLWSCLKALEISKYISPWDEMSKVSTEDAKIIAWMLRYPLSVRIKESCGHFIHFLSIRKTCSEKEPHIQTILQRYESQHSSPTLRASPSPSPRKMLSSNPFIYSPFMNNPENNSYSEADVSDTSPYVIYIEKGEEYKFVLELYNELKSVIPLEILDILTCIVDEESRALSDERNSDTFSIHSLPFLLSQGEQRIPISLKAEKAGHFCIVGFLGRLWNRICIDLLLDESQFVFMEIFSPFPTIETNMFLSSVHFDKWNQDTTSSWRPLQNNGVFWDGERVNLDIGLKISQLHTVQSVEWKLELQQIGTNGSLEYEEKEMNHCLLQIASELTNFENDSFERTVRQSCRCLLSSVSISPQNFIDNQSFPCTLELHCQSIHQRETQKMQCFTYSWMMKPSLVLSFIGLTKVEDATLLETEHLCYQVVLELENWIGAPINLDIASPTERHVTGLHLEPDECQRICFVLSAKLLSMLKQVAKESNGNDSFSNKAIGIFTSQLECHWECPLTQKSGKTPLRISSRLSACLDADLILSRAKIEFFSTQVEQNSNFFKVPCYVPVEIEIHVTNCWWQPFPEDLCLSLKMEQAVCDTWTNVMFHGVYGAGQWEDVECGNISPGEKMVHSLQVEFVSCGSYYLVAYLASSSNPWKTLRTKTLFLVQHVE